MRNSSPTRRASQKNQTIPTPIRVKPTVNMPTRSIQPKGWMAKALMVCRRGL